jgi:hypothetical protein
MREIPRRLGLLALSRVTAPITGVRDAQFSYHLHDSREQETRQVPTQAKVRPGVAGRKMLACKQGMASVLGRPLRGAPVSPTARAAPSSREGLFACSGHVGYLVWMTMLPLPNSVASSLVSDAPG